MTQMYMRMYVLYYISTHSNIRSAYEEFRSIRFGFSRTVFVGCFEVAKIQNSRESAKQSKGEKYVFL